jgi:predicted nucleotidyltransferase
MDSVIRKQIKVRLKDIEQNEGVKILLAVESGSRSWGFESPDSDYDIRFIYVHRSEWYLSIEEGRDVIELPFDGQMDISGWDIRKALRLFRKSNPVLMEWIVSPYVYASTGSFRRLILQLATKYYSKKAGACHYLNMAQSNYRVHLEGKRHVRLKKYFYVLRPLANILWLMENNDLIPMSFMETIDAISIPKKTHKAIHDLITAKKSISELGIGKRVSEIDMFISSAMKRADKFCKTAPSNRVPLEAVDRLFRKVIRE